MADPEILALRTRDGITSDLRRFEGAGARRSAPVIVAPALGVSASYYDPFASALADRGFDVFVAEHRGTGSSKVDPRKNDWGYLTMLEHDYASVLEAVRERRPDRKPTLLGHSLGGQLGALYESEKQGSFEALVLVASCSVHFRGWPLASQPRIFVSTQAAGLLGRALGYFPGDKVGFGGVQPTSVMRDWSRQARTGVYAPKGAKLDYEAALREVQLPVLAISIVGDGLAPAGAVDRLLAKMPRAPSIHERMVPDFAIKTANDPHFKWARNDGALVARIARFLADRS